jgi:LEA14-like dessication related protein
MNARMRGALVLILVSLLAGCGLLRSGLADPQVALVGLRMGPGDGLNQTVMVDLLVTNPNSVDLKLNAIQYRVRLDGRDLISGVSREPFDVPAGESARYAVPATISLLSGFGFIRDMLTKPRDKISYELNATLEPSGLFSMPITVRKADTVALTR